MTYITDITWADMTHAGIDIDHVHRQPNQIGTDEYVATNGSRRVAFGPAVDMEDGGTYGWDVSVVDVHDDDEWGDEVSQEWFETSADCLAFVRKSLR
jgi:hypothetical protein